MNVFNSVEGLHPRRNSFSAHTYRNDFTSPLGVNIPVYIQDTTAATKVLCSANALVRLQALIAPIMDNIDFYVHFWQVPYRLIENDEFTKFISGEIDPEDYTGIFVTPNDFSDQLFQELENYDWEDPKDEIDAYNAIVGNGSLLDFLGYDKNLFGTASIDDTDPDNPKSQYDDNGNTNHQFNYRRLIAYYMLHVNWYMNENVEYFSDFISYYDDVIKSNSLPMLCKLLCYSQLTFHTTLLPHGWEKDYFTSALPNVQFGDPVTLGLAGSAPVNVDALKNVLLVGTKNPLSTFSDLVFGFDRIPAQNNPLTITANPGDPDLSHVTMSDEESPAAMLQSIAGKLVGSDTKPLALFADLSEASAITINELRFANALQKFKERQMRFGRRRLEFYKGFFDVTPEDLRLQVPKYLGGGRIPINITDIEQTSQTSDSSPLAQLAGKATAVAGGFAGFNTWCSEETLIIGIAFAMPHITYANATSRFLFKTTDIYEYFNPSFEHLGEQAIQNIEVYAGSGDDSDKEFGYTPRYNEYRFHLNEVHGAFKDTLSYWTLARIFTTTPALNADFIYMQPSVFNRIFAVENEPPMQVSMLFRQRIIQPVSKYGTPMLLS